MSRSVNKIILVGNVGRDPDVRATHSGTPVANFSVATDKWVPQGEEEQTDWHRCIAWKGTAQFVEQYVRSGDKVYVEGEMTYGSYERDGMIIPTAEIIVRRLVLLSSKRDGAQGQQRSGDGGQRSPAPPVPPRGAGAPDDDMPF